MAISTSSESSGLPSTLLRPQNRDRFRAILDRLIAQREAEEQQAEAEQAFRKEQGEAASFEAEKEKCAADIIHWFNHWAWTYDPRLIVQNKKPWVPFKPWAKQIEFLKFVDERVRAGESWLCEKSRDQGASYLLVGYALHRWLFSPGFKTTFGSRGETEVDNRDNPDSIFEKLRIILRRLPVWMLPRGFEWRKHDTIMQLTNPENGCVITGEVGDNMGRGGRSSLYVVDEAAFLAHASKVEAALSGNVDCVGWVSTVNSQGDGNFFFTKRHQGVPERQIFRLHWRDDPRKNDAWAAAKKASLSDPSTWEAEYEINYHASKEGMCIPAAWVKSAQMLGQLEPDLPRSKIGISGGDVGGGKAKSVLVHRFGPIVLPVERRTEADTTDTAHWMLNSCKAAGTQYLNFDSVGIGAGVSSTLSKQGEDETLVRVPVNTGVDPTDRVWPDGRTSEEMFGNLKADIWWTARQAFQRTHMHVLWLTKQEGGEKQKLDELVALPMDAALGTQLSVVKWFRNEKGKIIIETKKQLSMRGVASPDDADAFVLTFLDPPIDGNAGVTLDVSSFHRENPMRINTGLEI